MESENISVPAFMHATIELRPGSFERFKAVMERHVVPFMEQQGWKLIGMFVQRTGKLNTIMDVWQLDDFQHYNRALQAFMNDDSVSYVSREIEETVLSETIVFSEKVALNTAPKGFLKRDGDGQ